MTTVNVTNVFKRYSSVSSHEQDVLLGLDAQITGAKFITLAGPNGCGKSTLINMIAGILKPDSGTVELQTEHGRKAKIGYVWQDYRASLLQWYDAGENLTLPLRIKGTPYAERRRIAQEAIKEFNADIQCYQRISELSGGQQQLVSLLRSTIATPDILLLDEPTSALDQQTSWLIAFHIEQIWMRQRIPAILVSHDMDQGILLADEIWVMTRKSGIIVRRIKNNLPRPRTISMLTSNEHVQLRAEIIEQLFAEERTTKSLEAKSL